MCAASRAYRYECSHKHCFECLALLCMQGTRQSTSSWQTNAQQMVTAQHRRLKLHRRLSEPCTPSRGCVHCWQPV